eukprot:1305711-Prymnesium_polylepis.1
MEEAAAADYMQAGSGPGDGAAAAQPAARDAAGVSASRTVITGGALASGEGGPGPAGTVADGSGGGPARRDECRPHAHAHEHAHERDGG